MLAKVLTSSQHPIIKKALKLRNCSSFREKERKVLIPGKKLILELSQTRDIDTLFIQKGASFPVKAKQVFWVSSALMKKITAQMHPEPVAALLCLDETLGKEKLLRWKEGILWLDHIQDPGNVGTLLRTALGFALGGVILSKCVDPLNDKVIRSSMGAVFSIPWAKLEVKDTLKKLEEKKIFLYTGTMKGESITEVSWKTPWAIVLGNEGQGVQETIQTKAFPVSIPMHEKLDSYNVATSGAILLFCMRYS